MAVPTPANAVAAFASFVRDRLADVGGTLAPRWTRHGDAEVVRAGEHHEAVGAARHLAMVIIGAAAPFAPTSHARARLLRQAHASGLLSDHEAEQVGIAEQLAVTGRRHGDHGSAEGTESIDVLGASG
jgi:hypothetical protein